jgi:hypothetical protein
MNAACERCRGACCETITLDVAGTNNDLLRFIELRSIPQVNEQGKVARNFNVPCSMLQDGRCAIYETRPQMCRDFIPGSAYCVTTVLSRRSAEEAAAICALLPNAVRSASPAPLREIESTEGQ